MRYMTNRDELTETFRNLEEPVVRGRIQDIQEISARLIRISGRLLHPDQSG